MGSWTLLAYVHRGIIFAEERKGTHPETGVEIVTEIPTDDDVFDDWVLNKRDFFDAEMKRIEALDEEYEKNGTDPEERYYSPYEEKPSRKLRYRGCYCFYYEIDLDGLMFTVQDYFAKFRLRNIPRGDDGNLWLDYLTMDDSGQYVLMPDTPWRYCVRFRGEDPVPVSKKDLNLYMTFADSVKIIDESIWTSQVPGQSSPPAHVLASTITKALVMAHNHNLRSECSRASSPVIHDIAEILLRAASPAGVSLTRTMISTNANYLSPIRTITGNTYKYRGCTILITNDCSNDERLKANTSTAVAHAREMGTDTSTVIILSIWHVAVVLISGAVSGKLEVSRSEVYPLLARFGFEEFDKALALLAHYLRPHCVDGPVPGRNTGGCEPSGRIRKSLSYDVLVQIMRLMDFKTYDTFALVSKTLRKEWFLHPRICNYTISRIKNEDVPLYRYFPRCTLQATREEDGQSVALHLFYNMPCMYKRFECGEYCYGKSCCSCPNPCAEKRCRKPVGLRMPAMDEERRRERERTRAFMTIDFTFAHGGDHGGDGRNYFSAVFRPRLSILDLSTCCEQCESVQLSGRERTSVAGKCLDKCNEGNGRS